MPKIDIMEKWGVSSGLVVDVRRDQRVRLDEARTREDKLSAGEESEITDGPDGKHFKFIRHRPITLDDARAWIRSSGDDPALYNISIRAIAYGHDSTSNRMTAWPKTGIALAQVAPLEQLYRVAAEVPLGRVQDQDDDRATVIVVSDWQIGKTGRRGGTPELLARLEDSRRKVRKELEARRPNRILVLDGGDGIEGFESGGDPAFTNDLSLPDQIDAYTTELFKFIRLADGYADTEVGAVPSNHAAWRRSKQNLGVPADDFGLLAHRQVAKVAEAAGMDVAWHFPEPYDESLCVDFAGTAIGLVHGNQFAPGKAIDWWQGQTFGDQAATRADVLVTAHYHSFGAGVAGQNPFSKRERMWLGAPTLDSGSDWYRNIKGRDSLPGTMIFDVTAEGFDLSSLDIL
jgi:hypothetical protein